MTTDFLPVDPWPVAWTCDVGTESPTATGRAVTFATLVLWSLTGRQFGLSTVTLRPCAQYAQDTPFPDGWLSWPGTQAPPLGATSSGGYYGWWFPAACGTCVNGCTCLGLASVKLPAPVYDVVEVRVDGSPLATGSYRLDENRFLVRTDGLTWPLSNNLLLNATQTGTWQVTARYGQAVPAAAASPIGELACEYLKASSGQDCRLPAGVTQLARQGLTISIPDLGDMLDRGRTGLYLTDVFIAAVNPGHLRQRSRTYSVDHAYARRVGT